MNWDSREKQAQATIDAYFERYPQVRTYMDDSIEKAKSRGYAETLFGRRRPIYGLSAKNRIERNAAERIAMNTPIQGSAADIIKFAMLRVDSALQAQLPEAEIVAGTR